MLVYGWQLAGSFSLSLLPSSLLHILSHGIFAILRTDGRSTGVRKKKEKKEKNSLLVSLRCFHTYPSNLDLSHSLTLTRSLTHALTFIPGWCRGSSWSRPLSSLQTILPLSHTLSLSLGPRGKKIKNKKPYSRLVR